MKNFQCKSYSKINICLNVLGKREDGYHELDMIMLPLELHDSILLTKLVNATENYITIDDFSVFTPNYNTVSFTLEKLKEKYNFNQNFKVYVHKNIPLQSGLGGGSSNAAFTMKAINKELKLGASEEEMIDMCKQLGADVSFFVKCVPSRCSGIGDIIKPITVKNDYYVLLVKPSKGCSTKAIYEISDEMTLKTYDIESVIKALETGDDDLLAASMGNALQDAAIKFVPEIEIIINELKSKGLKMVQMSGSGSCVFALSTDKKLLNKIADSLDDKYFVEVTKVLK